ncbi:sulfotransferase [Aestuariibacter sp. AA17]|uniref:Sulfotransferase n=1 Tax=Fluctibacter corallii TaxID=2984329 RepID=A0ABT3A811_9ALTE|nr:tetratricopeptide repeat-containing sulfotransferase family protein [Aestuariibacter sp. AA17]MCV2884422.1 sulfotransferase [Aestuariibacter sp. AA17]
MNITSKHQRAISLINSGKFIDAHPLLVDIVKASPTHADAYFLLGIVNLEVGNPKKAIALFEKALSYQHRTEYGAYLAKTYGLLAETNSVLSVTERFPASSAMSATHLDTFGVALSHVGQHELALRYFSLARIAAPDVANIHYNFGVSAKFSGEFAQAISAFEDAIRLQPNHYPSHFALSDLGHINPENNHIPRLETLFEDQNNTVEATLHIGHALCKEYEALSQYKQAFDALSRAKAVALAEFDYEFEQDLCLFNATKQLIRSPAWLSQSECTSDQPIFVLGMPRSGTTLLDRMLSNHRNVVSVGETQAFGSALKRLTGTAGHGVLDADTLLAAKQINMTELATQYLHQTRVAAQGAKRFIEKLPFNFFYLPLIRAAFPQAKIICMQRNPMDTLIGNYRQLFAIRNPYYRYAYSLESIAAFYREFVEVIDNFSDAAPDNFLIVNYEELVSDPETQLNTIVSFCQLDWEDNMVAVENNQQAVATASAVQVREAIHTRYVARWKHFDAYLPDWVPAFAKELTR